MTLEITQKDKDDILKQFLEVDVIFNRFDLRYDKYELFQIDDKYVPGRISNDTMRVGLFYRELSKKQIDELSSVIFRDYPKINYIHVENSLSEHEELMPELSYSLDLEQVANAPMNWLDGAKEAGEKLQKEQGEYKIVSTEKPARDDTTTDETVLGPDDPPFKPRLKNMDIIQLKIKDKVEAMLLVSKTGENIVFEHITSNHSFAKTYDIEYILCAEVILKFMNGGMKKVFFKGTTTELKRRLNASAIKSYSGEIWRKNKTYSLAMLLAKIPKDMRQRIIKLATIFMKKAKAENFRKLIENKTSDNYKLAKKDVWFDFYETKEDSDFSSYEYFNHETSKNYIESVFDLNLPFKKNQTFMDIGCGTGYVMYRMVDKFSKVYGIEINEKWVNIAKDNFAKLGIFNYEIFQQDINKIDDDVFDKADVFYLFNPFIGKTMRSVADRIALSFIRKPRKGWVIYINALNRGMFDNNKIFKVYKEFEANNRGHVVYKI